MPYTLPRCRVVPQASHEVAFVVEGTERLRWHAGPQYPRPFFFPLAGPNGEPLTRMGHPGAPDHDHHRSIWFAHEKVSGVNFWADTSPARVRQKQWFAYQDGADECAMAVILEWFDGHDPKPLMSQDLVAAVRPGGDGETFVELQSTFKPTAATIEIGKSNFGFLAVRVAKSISGFFGGGKLTGSEGGVGEPALFGKPARWVDYSGPFRSKTLELWQGVTYFDHPSNPGHPNGWHVREDGWMCSSPSMRDAVVVKRESPLVLRYLLHAHRREVSADAANRVADEFAKLPPLAVARAKVKHTAWQIERLQ